MSLRYGRRAGERGREHGAGHNGARLPGLRVEFAPLARENPDTHPGVQPLALWGIAVLDEQNLQFELNVGDGGEVEVLCIDSREPSDDIGIGLTVPRVSEVSARLPCERRPSRTN